MTAETHRPNRLTINFFMVTVSFIASKLLRFIGRQFATVRRIYPCQLPFLRYTTLNNGVPFKSVYNGHSVSHKWNRSIDRIRAAIGLPRWLHLVSFAIYRRLTVTHPNLFDAPLGGISLEFWQSFGIPRN